MSFSAVRYTDTKWMTQDGRVLNIEDMDLMHIFFSVGLLRKSGAQVPDLMLERLDELVETHPELFL